ncbi:diguanylate cyclase [Streptomyces sp. H27-D2]|uniref:diguanylate cyclase n=1 Tax=Streptomyces sp. H27-D2 TaxID=3046304 RepID=UPI002DBB3934|nr:diguanylate cyclase [Streptomyces sp. H27-D2]MEC4016969.1 diguanylate cyclase [Streptomyces sp. H27-D2]
MPQAEDFGAELVDFRRRVEELRTARALPAPERLSVLDAALFELQHAADVLWPRYEELAGARRPPGDHSNGQEQQLLRALFQRLPLAVALLDHEAVVRRLNFAATQLFGMRAGYATGRALTGSLGHSGRAVFRSQVAAVARGEGDRGLVVQLLRAPQSGAPGVNSGAAGAEATASGDGALRATLTALRPPRETRTAVLAVFHGASDRMPGTRGGAGRDLPRGAGHKRAAVTVLAEVSRNAELMDLLDEMTTALLQRRGGTPETVVERAAGVLHGRFADWVVVDLVGPDGGRLRRVVTLGPPGEDGGDAAERDAADPADSAAEADVAGQDADRIAAVREQEPTDCPLVVEAARAGASSLQVRPEDVEAFGLDAGGAAVLVRASVTSLLCVPLRLPSGAVRGVLTLFRTGGRRAFELAEAGAVDRMSRHLALALTRAKG